MTVTEQFSKTANGLSRTLEYGLEAQLFGWLQWRIVQTLSWNYNGSRVTWYSDPPGFYTETALGFSEDTNARRNEVKSAANASYVETYGTATFKRCTPWCYEQVSPWLRIRGYGNGTYQVMDFLRPYWRVPS